MKKQLIRAALVCAMTFVSGTSAQAQNYGILGKIAEDVAAAKQKTSGTSLLGSLGSVLKNKLIPTNSQIEGTWQYESPAIVFTSENALTNLGGSTVSKQLETKMQSHLTKYGIKKGGMTMTFNSDKTFSVTYKNRTHKGTYTIADKKVQMTFTGMQKPCKMTPQLEDGTLVIAADATKIKDFFQGIGAGATATSLTAITSILKKFNSMQIGMRLTKK